MEHRTGSLAAFPIESSLTKSLLLWLLFQTPVFLMQETWVTPLVPVLFMFHQCLAIVQLWKLSFKITFEKHEISVEMHKTWSWYSPSIFTFYIHTSIYSTPESSHGNTNLVESLHCSHLLIRKYYIHNSYFQLYKLYLLLLFLIRSITSHCSWR